MARDIVTLEGEGFHRGEPLIVPVMLKGKRIDEGIKLDEIRNLTLASYARLPKPLTILTQRRQVIQWRFRPGYRPWPHDWTRRQEHNR